MRKVDIADNLYHLFTETLKVLREDQDELYENIEHLEARISEIKKDSYEPKEEDKEFIKNFIEEHKLEVEFRVCSECGNLMIDGCCYDDGTAYYCEGDCLDKHFTKEEWSKECEENENSYWTHWGY